MTRDDTMPAPHMRKPRWALPALAGIACLALSGAPSPAQTVSETAHYQAELGLACSGTICLGRFPKLGNKRRLNVTRMTCVLAASAGAAFNDGYIDLRDADDESVGLFQHLPLDYSSPHGLHTLNRAIDMQVGPGQQVYVALSVTGHLVAANAAVCTASGMLQWLQ